MWILGKEKKKPQPKSKPKKTPTQLIFAIFSSLLLVCNTEKAFQFAPVFFSIYLIFFFLIKDTNNHVQNVLSYLLINSSCWSNVRLLIGLFFFSFGQCYVCIHIIINGSPSFFPHVESNAVCLYIAHGTPKESLKRNVGISPADTCSLKSIFVFHEYLHLFLELYCFINICKIRI